jgi:hypothetical protein
MNKKGIFDMVGTIEHYSWCGRLKIQKGVEVVISLDVECI